MDFKIIPYKCAQIFYFHGGIPNQVETKTSQYIVAMSIKPESEICNSSSPASCLIHGIAYNWGSWRNRANVSKRR